MDDSKIFKSPRQSGDYPDRHIDCQCAIEDAIITVIDYAQAAGWGIAETTAAIIELADNIALQHASLEDMRVMLEDLRRRDLK